MTHARIPDFSICLPSPAPVARILPADPIYSAIERHRAALEDYRTAPSLITNDEVDGALDALVVTPCASRAGAMALLAHLRTFLTEEADYSAGWWPTFQMAHARAADLQLLLGACTPPAAIPQAFPSGRMVPAPAAPLLPHQPRPLHLRVIRGLGVASELLAACVIVGGGCVLTGLASLL